MALDTLIPYIFIGLFFSLSFFLLKEILEESAGWRTCCQAIPNLLNKTNPVQVPEDSHDMVVDPPLERLQVILRREHRAGKTTPSPGRLRYERVLIGISACTAKVHSIRVPSGAIPQRTAALSRPWYQLSNAVGTVTVKVSVKQR